MVDVAKEVGADAVAHGCTGKGNDQVMMLLAWILIWRSSFNATLFCRFALSLHSMLQILNLKWWHLGGSGISQDVKMLLNMQRNIMYLFQFQRNQYTAEIETCGTLAMRYYLFSFLLLLVLSKHFCDSFFSLHVDENLILPEFYKMVTPTFKPIYAKCHISVFR